MCGLCGALGAPVHWADAAARPGVYAPRADEPGRRRERRLRVARLQPVLRHFGLKIEDWQGTSFLLADRTGGSELSADLGQVWAAAERLRGRPADPLDAGFIDALEAGHG